jgi:hypothetical protein
MLRQRILAASFLQLAWAIAAKRTRSFHQDAINLSTLLNFKVYGQEWVPQTGPIMVTPNHYYRPGYGIWNVVIALSAVVSPEIHWITTSMLTYPDKRRKAYLTPLSHFFLSQVARVYSFTTMPPMPPDPFQARERALAVRRVIKYINEAYPAVMIGLAPEGQDFTNGCLGWPPPGSGRFILHLGRKGLSIVPVGIFEEDGCLILNFGPPYRLEFELDLPAQDVDREVGRLVMSHLANLLPSEMRGEFRPVRDYPSAIP